MTFHSKQFEQFVKHAIKILGIRHNIVSKLKHKGLWEGKKRHGFDTAEKLTVSRVLQNYLMHNLENVFNL